MNRQQKEQLVNSLKQAFKESNACFVIGYKGLTVPQMQSLRKGLRKEDAVLRVSKARLMKRAVQGVQEGEILLPLFKDQIALVFASREAPSVAKVLRDFAKKHEALQILAASLEKQLLDETLIGRIASLPSKPELLAHVCRGLKAPLVGLSTILKLMILRLLWTLKKVEARKQQ